MTTCRSDRDGDGDVECLTAGGGPAAASTVERGACPGNRRLVPAFNWLPFAGWTLVAAGVAAYATRIQGSRPASNPGSEGLNIVPRAGVTSRFLLPQDCHHTRPGCERRREGLGHSLARECGRFRKRRCRASTLPLAALLMEPGERRVARGRHRARDRRHEVVQ